MFILAEDQLSRAIVGRLIFSISGRNDYIVLQETSGGIGHVVRRLNSANELAKREKVFVLVDLDNADCEPILRRKLLDSTGIQELSRFMIFSIAKREAESWLLADTHGLAGFLKISPAKIDPNAEETTLDPKGYLINLASKSRDRDIRAALVPTTGTRAKVGIGYNEKLVSFVENIWDFNAAASRNRSLKRTVAKINSVFSP